jgi:hypothetical protein
VIKAGFVRQTNAGPRRTMCASFFAVADAVALS